MSCLSALRGHYSRSRCVRRCDMQEHRHAKMNRNYSNSAMRRDEFYDVNVNNRNTASSSSSSISSSLRSSGVGLSPDHSNVQRRRGNHDNGCYGSRTSSSGPSERDGRVVREHHSTSVSRGTARSGQRDSTDHETSRSSRPTSTRVSRKPRYTLDDH